jgi:hypothetical protein
LANVQKKFRQAGLVVASTSIPQYLLKAVRNGRLSREEADAGGKLVWAYRKTR